VKIVAALSLLLLGCSAASSETSSPCGAYSTPAEAYQRATAVFAGRVTDVKQLETRLKSGTTVPYLEAKLRVEKSWKLIDREEIVVSTRAVDEGTCGNFKAGESYLVYADRLNDTFYVVSSSRTNPVAKAGEDLEFLGAARIPLRSGEFRERSVMTYGIIISLSVVLLAGWYLYRLHKKPWRA